MKKYLLLLVIPFFLFSVNSCKKPNEDPDDNSDTSGLAEIVPEGWQAELVDTADFDLGTFNKLAVDQNNGVHIIYTEDPQDNGFKLKYAYKPVGGTWTIEYVTDLYVEEYSDIAVDANNEVYVIFSDINDSGTFIKHKQASGASWTEMTVTDNHAARYPSITIDKNNKIHVSYELANYGMYYASLEGGSFVESEVNTENSSRNDIVVDKFGVIHIFFAHTDDIYHAYGDGTNWTTETVTTDAHQDGYGEVSAAIDTMGNINLVYELDATGGGYAYKAVDGNWSINPFYSSSVGRVNKQIDVDWDGNQYISFYAYHGSYFCVGFAHKNQSANNWSVEYLFDDSDLRFGYCTSVKVDKDYGLHVLTDGVSGNGIYYAYKENLE